MVRPGAAGYDELRRPAMAGFRDVRPQALVRCARPEDVAAALAFARAAGLAFAVRSGGHCFAGRSTTEGVVIDVSPLGSVAVEGDRATIGAGARLGDVYDALDAHGLTIPAGCGPTVGIAGLTLGGGLGILGRLHGLTSDALRAAQVVLADGRVVTCDDRPTRTSSGRCAAPAAPASASSPRSSSRRSRRRPRPPSSWCGRPATPRR